MIILGIDPGTATTGYAIIKTRLAGNQAQDRGEKPSVIDFGCIITHPSALPAERLKSIHREVSLLISAHQPDLMSVESLYFFKNLKTAMPVSQARGVILLAAAQKNVATCEFTPLQVKMTVTGYGKADKKQVQAMTRQLLNLGELDEKENHRRKDDAADALGLALCALLRHQSPLA